MKFFSPTWPVNVVKERTLMRVSRRKDRNYVVTEQSILFKGANLSISSWSPSQCKRAELKLHIPSTINIDHLLWSKHLVLLSSLFKKKTYGIKFTILYKDVWSWKRSGIVQLPQQIRCLPKIRFLRGFKRFCGKQNWHCVIDRKLRYSAKVLT